VSNPEWRRVRRRRKTSRTESCAHLLSCPDLQRDLVRGEGWDEESEQGVHDGGIGDDHGRGEAQTALENGVQADEQHEPDLFLVQMGGQRRAALKGIASVPQDLQDVVAFAIMKLAGTVGIAAAPALRQKRRQAPATLGLIPA
jgi:hypothetical protein